MAEAPQSLENNVSLNSRHVIYTTSIYMDSKVDFVGCF